MNTEKILRGPRFFVLWAHIVLAVSLLTSILRDNLLPLSVGAGLAAYVMAFASYLQARGLAGSRSTARPPQED